MRNGKQRGTGQCCGPRACGSGPRGRGFGRGMHRMNQEACVPIPDDEKEFLMAELEMLDANRKAIERRLSELG